MRITTAKPATLATLALATLGMTAATAHAADEPTPEWPGSQVVIFNNEPFRIPVPDYTDSLRVVVVGGSGGGAAGGVGAVVEAEIPVRSGQSVWLSPGFGGNAAVYWGMPAQPAHGGTASWVARCERDADCINAGSRVVIAGAGGGSGGGSWPLPAGTTVAAGGNAGEPGADVTSPRGFGGGRGMPGTTTGPGLGGAGGVVPSDCAPGLVGVAGTAGAPGQFIVGGRGGTSADKLLFGGDGGDGFFGGGGGGAAATCGVVDGAPVDHGVAAGGGGGSNLVPAGGRAKLNTDSRYIPQIRYSFHTDVAAPTISVTSPRAGATIRQGAAATVRFSCADDIGVASCRGTIANGRRLDTRRPGRTQLTVTATDRWGKVTRRTSSWTVVAARVTGLQASARQVRFALSGSAPVTVRIERRAAGRWRGVGLLRRTSKRGTTTIRLNGRVAGRRLAAGSYRAVVKPANAPAVTRRFGVR